MIHDLIGARQIPNDTDASRLLLPQLDEGWLPNKITSEQHAVADLGAIEFARQISSSERGVRPDQHHESKPAAVGPTTTIIPFESVLPPRSRMSRQGKLEEGA